MYQMAGVDIDGCCGIDVMKLIKNTNYILPPATGGGDVCVYDVVRIR